MITNFFDRYKNDIASFNNGSTCHIYRFLGAHPYENGVEFAVWAPNADNVSVCGDFNGWNADANTMTMQDGIWYAFVENAKIGDVYKYEIKKGNKVFKKADPVGFKSQLRPETGSVVALVEDSATVKTFYKEEGYYRLQPENDDMDPIIVKEAMILGKEIGVFRFL